ncbi:rho guanine nucleotide exchange factor 11 isoform X3 [Sceloporus undulatus]|uniref:rho guanine nucleotide exchange factor 11 isoform X3 n=1 Tax=Sceloporus undulatus TaxID=8520 RepID=UPI001C4BF34F|nr:rho guanine nucleotide exchange factor 11 isoform X3 [Sceloporus undulatus]
MNMRPPQTALDRPASKKHTHLPRLSSLSSLGDSAPERRSPGHHRQPSDASESTGLVQRCVIIQKDQHGFGFTVSGDRIVLVQSVRPGGAAMKAGVQEGDRIVKVNGTMVTNSSHLEVVKLIKSGAYVALTLLGSPPASAGFSGSHQDGHQMGTPQVTPACPPPPPPPPLPPPQHITGPKPLQDPEFQKHATQILRNMLKQEEAELQRCYEVYSRNPASLIEEQIEGARRRVSQLQLKIRQERGGLTDSIRPASDSSSINSRLTDGRLSLDSQDGDSGLDSGTERFPSISLNRNSVLSDPGLDSPHTSPVITSRMFQHHRRQGSDTSFSPSSTEQGLDRSGRPLIIAPEEDYDPGYFNNECDSLFQDLGKLKTRLAHLGVFLRYIFSQADPSPLLLYLCVDVYQQMNPKEARGLGKDIWNIFLDKTAPLRVKVSDQLLAEIDSRLRNGEDLRNAFLELQGAVMPEIQEQIQDYRTKRTMGLGSLYGENDLLELDGDPQKERQVAEKQITQLGDILSKYEEDRSSPMSFALNTYMSHAGIRPRESRPVSVVEKSQEKDKWLPFFPKTKKSSSTKKDKEALAEDKKRNPILKYIGKPKSSSQSTFHVPLSPVEVKPGNVRNIIQHFENNQHYDSQEPDLQRLSTGSFPEDLLEAESSRSEVKLGRSESLKGREELKRLRKADNVPRSRSDVDMDAAAEATRLHQSASSSASSLSARSLENPTPPYTPKMGRRSIESPNLGFSTDVFLPNLLEDELGLLSDLELEPDAQNWQHTVGREVVASLPQREVDRQEVINELFVTEASHLRILRVLDVLFYQRMKKENLLSREELALLFPNLPEVIEVHNSLSEAMKKLREEGPIIKEIGDLMLSRFDGAACEEIQQVAADFCTFQSAALELIKTKKRKEARFQLFMQEAESNPQCRRLQLKDLIISEMQRLTKYPLLLENIIKHTQDSALEHRKLCRARDQCRQILRYVNEAVKRVENQHRLEAYQKRLDTTSLERTSNPLAAEFKNLDLRSRRMIHEGLLSWRISKDKTVADLHVLLLEDLLVLLQRQDEKLVLKCHSKMTLGSSDTKQTFSPVLKLNSVLIRSVATDKRALFIICTSELGPQIYELVASTSSEKNMWMELLDEAVKNATRNATLPSKRHSQEVPLPQAAPSGLVLQDADISSNLTQDSCASSQDAEEEEEEQEPEPEVEEEEEEATAGGSDETPMDVLLEERHPVPAEVIGSEEEEKEEEEEEEKEEEEGQPSAASPLLPMEDLPLGERLEPDQPLQLPPHEPPAFLESLAESALEDVETLRHLLLCSFLPCRDPDEDVTPTPSVVGTHPHWDSALASQDSGSQEEPQEPTESGSPLEFAGHSPVESEGLQNGMEAGPPEIPGMEEKEEEEEEGKGLVEEPCEVQSEAETPLAPEPTQEAEGHGSYKVVRKAEVVEGTSAALPLPESSWAGTDAGDADNTDGNCFYLSMPVGLEESHTDNAGSTGPVETPNASCQAKSSPATRPSPGPQGLSKESSAAWPKPPEGPAPSDLSPSSQAILDVDVIFRTIEQLTVKLTRLKEVEMAHQQLLRSLSGRAAMDTAPVGNTLPRPSRTSPDGHPESRASGDPASSSPSLVAAESSQASLSEESLQEVTL